MILLCFRGYKTHIFGVMTLQTYKYLSNYDNYLMFFYFFTIFDKEITQKTLYIFCIRKGIRKQNKD